MSLAISLQHRLDALRKKCTTGYGCGSACISLRKECRTTPRSAIGKERMKRLLELAAGGPSSQRGIAPVRGKEAGELAGSIVTRRGEKASELKGARQQAATEKAQAAAAAAKASTSSPAPAGTPRGEADRAAKEGDPDYAFARASAVSNAGEDIGDSARHKRNAFRTIEEAEASGQVEKVLTRDNLLKNFPTDLISGASETNILSRLEAHFCLKAFPNLSPKDVDSYVKAQERFKDTGRKHGDRVIQEVDAKTVRKQYFDSFQAIRKAVEDGKDLESGRLRVALQIKISEMVKDLRKQEGDGYSRTYGDPYNPTANALISMQNRLGQRGPTSVRGQLNAFAAALKKEGQMVEARPTMERALDAGTKMMEGSSMAAAFGQQGNGKWRFSAADHYVGHARREGGRRVGGTPEAATDAIIKSLGFRGLQYGNSVTDDERKHHVQKAAEALVDLADATGLPDKAIGLNGTLGLAIGARGRGGAVAHYEPGMKVINLTRKNGVGSLSHEWGHALDNYAAGSGPSFLSENRGAPEKRAAMNEVKAAWTKSGYTQQVYDSIREIKKGGGLISPRYWTSDVEMFARSFEAHVSLKLAKAGKANTYLTREFDDSGMKKGNAEERRLGDGLWPTRKQAEEMEPMFDALLAQIRKDDFPGPNNRRDSREERIQRLIQEAYQAAVADHRADAVKRKCATGYSCGASCISMSKQCRKTPGAGPGQQKMRRILALAGPGKAISATSNASTQGPKTKIPGNNTQQQSAKVEVVKTVGSIDRKMKTTFKVDLPAAGGKRKEVWGGVMTENYVETSQPGGGSSKADKLSRAADLGRMLGVKPLIDNGGGYSSAELIEVSFGVGTDPREINAVRKALSPEEGATVARTVFRQAREMLKGLPDGTILTASAYNKDGFGHRRKQLYETLGFQFPEGSFEEGLGIIKNGKIAKPQKTRSDASIDSDEAAFVRAALELPEFGGGNVGRQDADILEARLDALRARCGAMNG